MKELLLRRVELRRAGVAESIIGRLDGVKANGDVFFRPGMTGPETLIPAAELEGVVDAPLTCSRCATEVQTLPREGLCANCVRADAAAEPARRQPCDTCGKPGGFRSPRAPGFHCGQCHAGMGTLTGTFAESRVLTAVQEAVCRGLDPTDERHAGPWIKVRRTRERCRACQVDRFV